MFLFLCFSLAFTTSEACTPADDAGIVINELYPDPPGPDADREWIELLVTGSGPVDLEGWWIAAGTRSLTSSTQFPPRWVEPGAYLVVGLGEARGDVQVDGPSLGNASADSADAVALVDCFGTVADTVIYGPANLDGFIDDRGEAATSLGPVPGAGESLGRSPDGADTDRSGDDFAVRAVPSPGGPHPESSCRPSPSGLVINELMPDPSGPDAGFEWIELLNAGSEAVDVNGWAVQTGTATLVDRVHLPDEIWDPGTRWLVAEPQALVDADARVDELGLGNAGANADAVRLVDCAGQPVDTVVYGGPNVDGFADDVDDPAQLLAPGPEPAASLGRRPDGVDRDDNATDFAPTTPTPGAPNSSEPLEFTVAPANGCTRPREAPVPRDPNPGCAVPPNAATWLALAGVLVGWRRRATSRPSANRSRGPCARPSPRGSPRCAGSCPLRRGPVRTRSHPARGASRSCEGCWS